MDTVAREDVQRNGSRGPPCRSSVGCDRASHREQAHPTRTARRRSARVGCGQSRYREQAHLTPDGALPHPAAGVGERRSVGAGGVRIRRLVVSSDGCCMRYAAFLRGINLGGRRVTGPELCAPFEELGFHEVASFLASGNVVFDADDAHDLESRIEEALASALGYPVETFVRSADEVSEIVARRPFPAEVLAATEGKLQVTFLRRIPAAPDVAAAVVHATDEDRLAVIGREWYWLPSGGISRSALDLRAVEQALGRGTTRTANTVARLHARFLAGAAGR
jgi:uncharacterized protein (DUF1697 family)